MILGAIKQFSGIEYSIIESKSEIKFKNLTSLAVDMSEAMQSWGEVEQVSLSMHSSPNDNQLDKSLDLFY